MNEGMISSRYAQALLLTLQTDAAGELAYADAKRMLEVYETSGHQINVALQSEIVPRAQKESFLRALFEKFGPSLLPLANLMLTRHRAIYIPRALRVFISLYRQSKGIREAQITTAVPLLSGQKEKLLAFLQQQFGGQVELSEKVDPGLIGGFQVEVSDRLLDRSVRGELLAAMGAMV